MKNKFLLIAVLGVIVSMFPVWALAQTQTDWIIRDFKSTIAANRDSSLLIEERITADCDSLPGKHGIFRVVPTRAKAGTEIFDTPIKLVGITDFDGKPLKYSESVDRFNHTVSWKIGDPDVTVQGLNYYKITYRAQNAIRFGSPDFDELYWNLSGNFWEIPVERFSAAITFPEGVNSGNSQIDYYAGYVGEQGKSLAVYSWAGTGTLAFQSTQTLLPGQGITASVTFPKGTFISYVPGFFERYGIYFWLMIPLAVFILSYLVWKKYGRDPRMDKTITPEFGVPDNLTPMELGMLAANGGFRDEFISATIVDLAARRFISIEEIKKTGIFGGKDYQLKKTKPATDFVLLPDHERALVDGMFGAGEEVTLSSLKDKFYEKIPAIKKAASKSLLEKGLIVPSGRTFMGLFIALAVVFVVAVFVALAGGVFGLAASLFASAAILLFFGLYMPKRTPKGAELNWRVKGFRLYMETAEKYRQQFNEKENIFEKFLPYAMVFGIVKLWVKKMETIYGSDYFQNYHPVWYMGTIDAFNADSFADHLNSLSSNIASNAGTASGAAGAGGAGGGGGGGGGSGW